MSQEVNIPVHTIRYYERLGLIPQPSRADNNYRLYSEEHEKRLIFIQKAKRFGLSLEEIKTLVDISGKRGMPCEEVKKLVKMHLQELDGRIQNMIAFRDELADRYRRIENIGTAPGAVCGLIEGESPLISIYGKETNKAVPPR